MKKALILFLAVALAPVLVPTVRAEEIKIDTAAGAFILPFQIVKGTQLYSFAEGKGFPGAETVLWKGGRYEATFGAAPVIGTETNVPFFGIQHRLNPAIFDISNNELEFGVWVGKPSHRLNDQQRPRWVWGIKASVPLW